MAKRGATSQITREGGGVDGDDDDQVEEVEEKAPPVERRVIRGLPSRKTANLGLASPGAASTTPPPSLSTFGASAGFGAPPANPFGGVSKATFSFGAAPASPAPAGDASTKDASADATAKPNPFSSVPSNPFASIPVPGAPKPAAATPFSFGAAPVDPPAPASTSSNKANPFAFGSVQDVPAPKTPAASSLFSFNAAAATPPAAPASTPSSPFTFGSAKAAAPSSTAPPPPPASALPWGSTPYLPGDKDKGAAPTSLDAAKGGPVVGDEKKKADDAASTVSQGAASTSVGGFSFGVKPPANSAVVPPPPAAALPWGSTPILPGEKAGDAPKSLEKANGGPVVGEEKKDTDMAGGADAASVVAQPASTPAVEREAPSFARPTLNGTRKNSLGASASSSMPPPPFPRTASAGSTGAADSTTSSSSSTTEQYLNLRGLNVSLVSLLESLVAKDPFIDLSRTLSDLAVGYKSKRTELDGKPSSSEASANPVPKPTSAHKPPASPPKPVSPPKPPVFASTGGFTFGGKKLDTPAGEEKKDAASPFGGFPSTTTSGGGGGFTFGGAKAPADDAEKADAPAPKTGGFTFNAPASSSSTTASKPTGGFSFTPTAASPAPPAVEKSGTKAGAFLTSVLGTPPTAAVTPEAADKPADAPKSAGGLFSFSTPSSSTPAAPAAPASPFSFGAAPAGSSSTPAAPAPQPPAFARLPSGTPNFSFGGAPKRSVSSSSFSFGGDASSSSSAPAAAAPAAPVATAAETETEDPPAPTIPSDPTLLEKGEGEEDEETHFEAKAAIHRLGDDKKWEKVGNGLLKVKSGGASGGKGRVLARVEGSGNLLVNFAVHDALKPNVHNGKSVMLLGFDGTTPRSFLIRVKDAASANALKAALDERMAAA